MKKSLSMNSLFPRSLLAFQSRFFNQRTHSEINVNATRLLQYYHSTWPEATPQNYAEFLELVHHHHAEVYWVSDKLRPNTLAARITIVEQLSHYQQLRSMLIPRPLLEFKVIQAVFQEEIQRHLQHLLNNVKKPDDAFFEEANYFMELAQEVNASRGMGPLTACYEQLQGSKYPFRDNRQITLEDLQSSGKADYRTKASLTLNYLFTGKLDARVKACLLERCYHDPDFLNEPSITEAENQVLFIKLKGIFENMANYLQKHDITFKTLLTGIQRSENIIELMKALFTRDDINPFCSIIEEVQRNPEIFDKPENIELQLEYLLVNPPRYFQPH